MAFDNIRRGTGRQGFEEQRWGRRFAEIAFTPAVKEEQERHGSRRQYQRVEEQGEPGNRLGPHDRAFIQARDGFYMSPISETGRPYIQYRGGPKGFLKVLDDRTLGFADLGGNMQYISTGNLKLNDRVALFLMGYPIREGSKYSARSRSTKATRRPTNGSTG